MISADILFFVFLSVCSTHLYKCYEAHPKSMNYRWTRTKLMIVLIETVDYNKKKKNWKFQEGNIINYSFKFHSTEFNRFSISLLIWTDLMLIIFRSEYSKQRPWTSYDLWPIIVDQARTKSCQRFRINRKSVRALILPTYLYAAFANNFIYILRMNKEKWRKFQDDFWNYDVITRIIQYEMKVKLCHWS